MRQRRRTEPPARIGLVGTGFIARGLIEALEACADLRTVRVLTRRPPASCGDFPRPELLTNSLAELLDRAELVAECSGDPLHATEVVAAACAAGTPIVTMNAEFHVTAGSEFVARGLLTEAEGDQPGCLAALRREALDMGFSPLVYGNIKGFLDPCPTPAAMEHWSRRQGIAPHLTVAFTDGTKLQIEQALVANGLGADIARPGLLGPQCDRLPEAADALAAVAAALATPLSDYVLSGALPPGVFLTATHRPEQQPYLRYLKLGDGPYYTLLRNHHLCHLEAVKTIRAVLRGEGPLLNNSATPRIGVAAVAKRPLPAGLRIDRGIGGYDVRGIAVRIVDCPDHVPIGLLSGGLLRRAVPENELLSRDDVELPASRARDCWEAIRTRALNGSATATLPFPGTAPPPRAAPSRKAA